VRLGLAEAMVSRGIALADVDGDGRLDFAVANQWEPSYFYHNECPDPGHFLGLHLVLPLEPMPTEVKSGLGHRAQDNPGRPAIGAIARVHLPDGHMLLGQVDGGSRVLMKGLDTERTVLSGGPLGIMQAAMDLVIPYVHERKQFGQPIGTFELMQGKLADLYASLNAARAYVYTVARACDARTAVRRDAAACILFAAERATHAALEAIQALGGNGYINDYPAGRLLRDAKLYEIGAGTQEIRRMLIGRELFEAAA
jgi:hypothetical protein